jgi:hypothetical protein
LLVLLPSGLLLATLLLLPIALRLLLALLSLLLVLLPSGLLLAALLLLFVRVGLLLALLGRLCLFILFLLTSVRRRSKSEQQKQCCCTDSHNSFGHFVSNTLLLMRLSLAVHGAPIDSKLLFPPAARVSFFAIHLAALLSNTDARKRMEQSKNIEEPQHHANHHDSVQDRLNAACHGDKPIHQPQKDSHDDQGQ